MTNGVEGKNLQKGHSYFEREIVIIEYIEYWLYHNIAVIIGYNVETIVN